MAVSVERQRWPEDDPTATAPRLLETRYVGRFRWWKSGTFGPPSDLGYEILKPRGICQLQASNWGIPCDNKGVLDSSGEGKQATPT